MVRGRALLLVPIVAVACGNDDHAAVVADAGIVDAGPSVAVHTNAPAFSLSLPGPNSATFAMALGDDNAWHPLAPAQPGLYAVPFHGDRWTAAFVCADEDNAYVRIYDRAVGNAGFTVELDNPCALENGNVGDLTGHFAHAPPATSWLDFAYIVDERGYALPLSGDGVDYELVNVVTGKWDLIFGFRDDSAGPLTKLFFMRDETLAVSGTKLDADVGAAGAIPGSKALTVTGATPDEYLNAPVIYTLTGSPHGVDMGPQSAAGPNLVYSTVPPEQQRPDDRYRLTLTASAPEGGGERGARGVFHDAVDVNVDLPAALGAPVFAKVGDAPYLRVSMKTIARANAAVYELAAITEVTDQKRLAWIYSTDAAFADGAEVAFEMPDFSAVPGWNNAWTIQPDRTKITATVREKTSPLADGTLERFASSTVRFTP
jgi:hypothetical protein